VTLLTSQHPIGSLSGELANNHDISVIELTSQHFISPYVLIAAVLSSLYAAAAVTRSYLVMNLYPQQFSQILWISPPVHVGCTGSLGAGLGAGSGVTGEGIGALGFGTGAAAAGLGTVGLQS
jgi:hypothetical protein